MKLVWTKSSKPLSVVIRLITGEDCSHFSFVFTKAAKGLMFESNLFGTHPAFFQTSLKDHEIVHEMELNLSIEQEDEIWDRVIEKYDNKPYDFGGILYIGWRKILYRIFGTPIPLMNRWANPNAFFCNELAEIFEGVDGLPSIGVANGMETPHDVWLKFRGEDALRG